MRRLHSASPKLNQRAAAQRRSTFSGTTPGRLLADFVGHLETAGSDTITIDAALSWATRPSDADPSWWGHRLSVVRVFARHLHAIDPVHEVPPAGLLPARNPRATPYLYANTDIVWLMTAARGLRSTLRAATF